MRLLVVALVVVAASAVALPWFARPVAADVDKVVAAGLAPMPEDDPRPFSGNEILERLMAKAEREGWRRLPIGDLIGRIGLELRATPYVASTLELDADREVCSVNLLGLDCVTFFESALGMARMIKDGKRSASDLLDYVTYTRYRDGRVGDYTSRLHYTTDWFYDNEEKRVVRNVTRELPGAERFTRRIDFMSTHPDAYMQLKAHPEMVAAIAEIERRINGRTMYYVPKAEVAAAEEKLQTGDIVGITTTIGGIDIAHTGLLYRDEKGVLRLLHASVTKKEVILDERLSSYLNSVSKHTGIMVVRPLEP